LYESLTDIHQVEVLANAEENQQMEGAALVTKVWIYATLTNAYGDIPYSQAIQGGADNFTPSYDSQDAIYEDLLATLDRAKGLLSGAGSISGDIIYNGNAASWVKLANGLTMRLLMTAGDKISSAASKFATVANSGQLMTKNSENATLTYLSGFPNQFPLIPIKTGDFDAVAISKTALDIDGI
jgi:hypothetical protein